MEVLNLTSYGVEELSSSELQNVEGGIGFLAAAALVAGCGLLGVGAGYGLCCLLD